jgi:hypothetical protein
VDVAEEWNSESGDEDFLIEYVTPDAYGVPSNLLGRHREDMFSMVGRIVMLSATLENRLLSIYQSLVGAGQNKFTTVPVGQLIDRCGSELDRLDDRPDHRQLMETFLADAKVVIERRNHYVHNLWPAQAGDKLWGWRPSRDKNVLEAVTVETTLEEMRTDLKALVAVLEVNRVNGLISIASSCTR